MYYEFIFRKNLENVNVVLFHIWYETITKLYRKSEIIQPRISDPKGKLILKCLFGVFDSSKKMNENNSTWGIIVVKSKFLVYFLENWG